jgi:hypothetical protein
LPSTSRGHPIHLNYNPPELQGSKKTKGNPEVTYESFKEWMVNLNRDQKKELQKQVHIDLHDVKEAIDQAVAAKIIEDPATLVATSDFNKLAQLRALIEVAYIDLPFGPSDEMVEAMQKLI